MKGMSGRFREWRRDGVAMVWFSGAGLALMLLATATLIGYVAVQGLGAFWPKPIVMIEYDEYHEGYVETLAGQVRETFHVDAVTAADLEIELAGGPADDVGMVIAEGNKEFGAGTSRTLYGAWFKSPVTYPKDVAFIERLRDGAAIGWIESVTRGVEELRGDPRALADEHLSEAQAAVRELHRVRDDDAGDIGKALTALAIERRKLELDGELTADAQDVLMQRRAALDERFALVTEAIRDADAVVDEIQVIVRTATGQRIEMPLGEVVRIVQPNRLGWLGKAGVWLSRVWEFLSADPREANTEGGVFPAIYGTVMMVLVMTIFVMPIGVLAAVYLHEYSSDGWIIRTIRVSVANLAGVPSIVFGIFAFGCFVYLFGGAIDQAVFPERLPDPTLGTGGLLWAALTLALLTLPVVILSTAEGLARVPQTLREASYALGSTKAEMLWKVVVPSAMPAIMTGLILAVARAAGEVAPLMLVGVVKLAPDLPVDLESPFIHPERKFMHLGFHVFDLGFQSPDVDAARGHAFATALLLVLIVVVLNLAAIVLRNAMRERQRRYDG